MVKDKYQMIDITPVRQSSDDNDDAVEDDNHVEKSTDQNNIALPAQDWPKEPIALKPSRMEHIFMTGFDLGLILVPIVLLIKVGIVIHAWTLDRNLQLDQSHVSMWTQRIIAFNGQLVTLFTIVFITTLSTMLRRYALWKAQKGAYISELEQLQGSVSLPSTVRLILSLRAWKPTSIILLGIWSFYYLGSQASKLEYRFVMSDPLRKSDRYALSQSYPSFFSNEVHLNDISSDVISDSLTTTVQSSTVNNVGTDGEFRPVVLDVEEWLKADPGAAGKNGWLDAASITESLKGHSTAVSPYTAWIGKSLYDSNFSFLSQAIGTYATTTSYLSISCDLPTQYSYDSFPSRSPSSQLVTMAMIQPEDGAPKDRNGNTLRQFELWQRWVPTAIDPTSNDNITTSSSARTVCSIKEIMVDIEVKCTENVYRAADTGCFVQKIRYVNNSNLEGASRYDTPFDDDSMANNLLGNFSIVQNSSTAGLLPHSLWNYLNSSSTYEGFNTDDLTAEFDHSWVPVFKTYLNTFYMLSQEQVVASSEVGSIPDMVAKHELQVVKFDGSDYYPHYAIYWEWIALDIVSCLVLLGAAIVSLWLRLHTLAPDIFGYVSSLTRDNPHLHLPDNGSTLSGLERARLLRNVKVKIGDVSRDDEQLGRVGLARMDSGSRRIAPLDIATTYV